MKILGVDPSLSGTGLATYSTTSHAWRTTRLSSVAPPPDNLDPLLELIRFRDIVRRVVAFAGMPDAVVVESPAYSRTRGKTHERAGLWWAVYGHFADAGCQMMQVRPNVRAKYATGSGVAGKDEVMLAAVKRYPQPDFKNNDEADAVILTAMGARLLGKPVEHTLPVKHLEAMRGLGFTRLRDLTR